MALRAAAPELPGAGAGVPSAVGPSAEGPEAGASSVGAGGDASSGASAEGSSLGLWLGVELLGEAAGVLGAWAGA